MQRIMSRNHARLRRMLSLFLAVMLVLALALYHTSPAYADDTATQLRQKLQEYQAELDEINEKLEQAQSNTDAAEETKNALEQQKNVIINQIAVITQQINEIDQQINEKQTEIDQKQAEVDQKQAEYDARWEGFKERMRAMQILNDGGSIALLSQATDLYQLLTFYNTLEQIASKDTEICEELDAARAELETEKAELETAKADLETKQAELQESQDALSSKQAELAVSLQAANEELTAAEAEEEAMEAAAAEARKQVDAAAAELDSYLASQNKKYGNASISCSLNFGAPLATYKYVSCEFGVGGHRGTDYAAPGGTEIYAIADGIVTASGYHYSWGNYCQVYHGTDDNGNTYSTLYAHMMQTPSVSEGQTVTKGQVLGYVGTTGYSTGNHLHLELKVNGVLTNVRNYLG